MSTTVQKAKTQSASRARLGKLFVLDLSGARIFSINTDGGDLRQLTRLRDDKRPTTGCFLNGEDRACTIVRVWVDRLTGAVGFASTCDPLGRNPFGYQAFSMRPDGSGLRQLTSTRGRETDPDGTLHVELPGPIYFR